MRKPRLFFFIVFGLYHLAIFLFVHYMDAGREDAESLAAMHKSVHVLKYTVFGGLLLFVVDFIWSWQTVWMLNRRQGATQAELNRVKAKLYDLQEDSEEGSPVDTDDGATSNTE